MARSSRIILHIGAPKTGSTYLQKRLRHAPDLVRSHGLYVPVLPIVARMAGNAKLLPVTLDKQASPTFRRSFPAVDVQNLEPAWVLNELTKDWHQQSEALVLSAENFRPHHAQAVRRLLPADADCTVVLFIRRQDHWVESYYNQNVKSGRTGEPPSTFALRICSGEEKRLCCPDWSVHYKMWREVFGRCEVVIYDDVKADLLGAFFEAAGLNPIPGLPEIARAQMSLDLYHLAYLLQGERASTYSEFARRRAAGAAASKQLGWQGPYSLLAPRDRARLKDQFQASNDRLLTDLGRDPQQNSLEIASESPDYFDLDQLYASPAYAAYREMAEALFAGESL